MSMDYRCLERLLECPVCRNTTGVPKCLPCEHIICQECVQKALQQVNSNN